MFLLDKDLEMKGRQTSPETEPVCNQRGLQSLREVRLCMWSKWGGGGVWGLVPQEVGSLGDGRFHPQVSSPEVRKWYTGIALSEAASSEAALSEAS